MLLRQGKQEGGREGVPSRMGVCTGGDGEEGAIPMLLGAPQTRCGAGCGWAAAAFTAPESKIPSLWAGGQPEWLHPRGKQRERATCQLFSQSIFH